ncbi:MAG: acetylxylan esterase [Lentisphaeria bacterium]|nr:acetylxylan esterase [Lentisphaeria bacterium]
MKKIVLLGVCGFALFCGCKSAPEYREASFKFDFPVPANIRPILYRGADFQGKPTEVFAWLGVPENCKGKVPGIVLIHGGGGTAFLRWVEDWTKRGYAAIAVDTVGCRPLLRWEAGKGVRERLANGGPDYPSAPRDIDNPADAWTTQALEALYRGHSILRSLPEVDPERTAVYGISWGGYLTCWAAAADPRYKAAVSLYGCGFLKQSPRTVAKVVTPGWFDLFDPALVLEEVHCPILFVTQPVDADYQWDSWCRSTFLPEKPSRSVPGLIGHSHTRGLRKEAEVFIDSVLKGTPGLPEMGEISRKGSVVSAEFRAGVLPVTGELWWTCDDKSVPAGKRQWKSAPAEISGNTVSGKLPDGAKDWFLNVRDSRGVTATALRPHYE